MERYGIALFRHCREPSEDFPALLHNCASSAAYDGHGWRVPTSRRARCRIGQTRLLSLEPAAAWRVCL